MAGFSQDQEMTRLIKVWNPDKSMGFLIPCLKFEDLMRKAKEKFGIPVLDAVKIVMRDGLQIQEDSFEFIDKNAELFILRDNDALNLPGTSSQENIPPIASTKNLMKVVNIVRSGRKGKPFQYNNKTPQRKEQIKISLGWLCYDGNRLVQVRSANGGGTRVIDFQFDTSYNIILQKARELFFPNDESSKGPWHDFINNLGDFKQNVITATGFTLTNYIQKHCLTSKPRIYLLSKPKPILEQDYELPDLTNSDSEIEIITDSSDNDNSSSVDDTNVQNTFEAGAALRTEFQNYSSANSCIFPNGQYTSEAAEVKPKEFKVNSDVNHDRQQNVSSSPFAFQGNTSQDDNSVRSNDLENTSAADNLTVSFNSDQSFDSTMQSPVVMRMPPIPTCTICSDRYCDSFLTCGHVICLVCAMELEERGSYCHVCRQQFTKISKIYW